jgi:DNA mismatch endonuclease (patch repair protein)
VTASLRAQTTGVSALEREAARLFPRAKAQYPLLKVIGARRTADFAYPRRRVAVFVDGCLWHGCPVHNPEPPPNKGYDWEAKLARTVARDRDTDARLKAAGWRVVRVWEHDLKRPHPSQKYRLPG